MSSSTTLKALGLNYSPNALSLPDGSLATAKNVIVRRDNVLESRRGFKDYSQPIGLSTDYVKQLIEYKDRILCHSSNKLYFDTGKVDNDSKAIFSAFAGTYNEVQVGLRIKSIEANKNLYFTTDEGIKKISAATASNFTTTSGYIKNAGVIKALDLVATLDISQGTLNGFLPNDSAVAYRYLFGYKDANNNLLLGAPSDRVVVYNYLSDVIAMDLNTICNKLDVINQSTCLITDGDYASTFYSPVNSADSELLNNIVALATKLDNDIYLANDTGTGVPLNISTAEITSNVATITFSSGDPSQYISSGDILQISGATASGLTGINGNKTITSVTSTTISFVLTAADVVATNPGASTTIYSYNYRNIVNTGDNTYTTALSDLVLSIPPTSEQTRTINNNLVRILERLKIELSGVIPTTLQTQYITPITSTESANVKLNITIPSDLPSDYFVQVYRTRIFTATSVQTLGGTGGVPIVPDDEMRLVFETFPSTAQITAEQVIVVDDYPDSLVQNNTNLYTNPTTGEGIAQANDLPPLAKDINFFKNYTFFANTRTKHRLTPFQLLGVSNITSGDTLVISNGTTNTKYTFVTGVQEVTDITFTTLALIDAGKYFIIYSANDGNKYYFYYTVDGTGTAPVVTDGKTVEIDVLSTFTASQVAQRSLDVINEYVYDFLAAQNTLPKVRITNVDYGSTTNSSAGTTGFTVTTVTQGNGENASLQQVLLSDATSAAQAIDDTARSLVRVINKQTTSPVFAYYISGDNTPPGQINLEAKSLSNDPFYVQGSNSGVGISFNPDISPVNTNISSISVANPTVITTSTAHGLNTNDKIFITNSNSTPSVDGIYSITYIDSTHFSIPVNVTIAGTQASWSILSDVAVSNNETKPNRIYYSKVSQPEAVPILNYIDISAEDKEILRIYPLRDSLFVFKEDGLFRVSGEVAPFVTQLFDTSIVLIAPDSLSVANNLIYGWTSKGISTISETGSREVSRPIDTEILRLSSAEFSNFNKVTWGVGYDSDNSYTVYTNSETTDEVATIAFRYSNLTNTWTNFILTQTCGLNNKKEDKLYQGSGIENIIVQERKTFTREDYTDKDFAVTVNTGGILNNGQIIALTSVSGINVGDVFTQEQTLSIYDYNKLLGMLDADPTVSNNDYFSSLEAKVGDNMRLKLVALASKLDSDPGVSFTDYSARIATKSGTVSSNSVANPTIVTASSVTGLIPGRVVTISGTQTPSSTPSIVNTYTVSNVGTYGSSSTFTVPVAVTAPGGTGLTFSTSANLNSFQDLKACFNEIINRLNADPGVTYSNYRLITSTTLFEAVVTNVNKKLNQLTLNLALQFVTGESRIYTSIPCEIQYSPNPMGDPLMLKHMYEATFMFNNNAFTQGTIAYSSDLQPEFVGSTFYGQGNGIFGHYSAPGFGFGFFGGSSNSAPVRTYIPRNAQRCRYLNVKYTHSVAREQWALFGITLTGNIGQSTRAYR